MNDYTAPNREHIALLTIDTQRDFALAGAPAEIPGTAKAIPSIQQLVWAFRRRGRPIIHVVRLYLPDGSNVDLCRRRDVQQGRYIVAPGSDGAELVDELKPSRQVRLDHEQLLHGFLQLIGPEEWVLYKPRWGAFYQTSLREHLAGLEVDSLVICGCNFPNCPRTTVYEASERDLRVALVADATSGVYERGLHEMRNIGVTVMDTRGCLAWLEE